jgi:hypothetical protein
MSQLALKVELEEPRSGIYVDLPPSDYHEDDALGSSNLKTLLKSPEDYNYSKNNPSKSTKDMILGTALHYIALESTKEEDFLKEFKVHEDGKKKTFRGEGELEISESNYKEVLSWHDKLVKTPEINEFLNHPDRKTELSYFWEEEGVRMKCRFDLLLFNNLIIDLKTINTSASKDKDGDCFNAEIANRKYYLSAQHYLNGLRHLKKANGLETGTEKFAILYIEKNAPNRIALRILSEESCPEILAFAQNEIEIATSNYLKASSQNTWIDPMVTDVYSEEMPGWFRHKINN